MRTSQVPQNSRELAVRNQFFTPRYVVEFLTDNALGHIWYEMRRGQTKLVEKCRYLVQRRYQIWLNASEAAPQPFEISSDSGRPSTWHERANMWTRPNPALETWEALKCYALTIDGYRYARENFDLTSESIGSEIDAVANLASSRLDEYRQTGLWHGTFEELHVCLFFELQHWKHNDIPSNSNDWVALQALYKAICEAWDREVDIVPFRAKKDPRDLKILDPACGSGHFLLYAFDLFETIYEEAWFDSKSPISKTTGTSLQQDYPDLESLRRTVPSLIIRYNLYGVDIDPRACQIAALALWLRAQRGYQQLGLKSADRPSITRSNIVCAEPMPGEREILDEYLEWHIDPRLHELVRAIWEKMQLAGEVGTLLKIEREIDAELAKARERAMVDVPPAQMSLVKEMQAPVQQRMIFATSEDRAFWDEAEKMLLNALQDYAAQASNGHAAQYRLFVEDALQGFAFIDLCRTSFDVALMNPPFGSPSGVGKAYTDSAYTDCKEDIDAAFIQRGIELLSDGFLGAVINRTQLFKPGLRAWREHNLLDATSIDVAADLGHGVLDSALVEVATYVIRTPKISQHASQFFRLLKDEDKASSLLRRIEAQKSSQIDIPEVFTRHSDTFRELPESRISYWASDSILSAFKCLPSLEGYWGTARQGSVTSDNFRFLRLCWEVPSDAIALVRGDTSKGKLWALFAKGGEYSPYFQDLHLLVKWKDDGREIRNLVGPDGRLLSRPQNLEYNFKLALTYSERTASGFSPRVCPPSCVYSHMGPIVAVFESRFIMPILGILMSRICAYFIELMVESADAVTSGSAARHYTQGIIGSIPAPKISDTDLAILTDLVTAIWTYRRDQDAEQETGRFFTLPGLLFLQKHATATTSLNNLIELAIERKEDSDLNILRRSWQIEQVVRRLYELDLATVNEIDQEFGKHPETLPQDRVIDDEEFKRLYGAQVKTIIAEEIGSDRGGRAITKKAYFADRKLELLCGALQAHPSVIVGKRRRMKLLPEIEVFNHVDSLISYAVGCIYGRWDIRSAIDPSVISNPSSPLDLPPVCSPGMLVDLDGFPVLSTHISNEEWHPARANAITPQTGADIRNPTISDAAYPIQVAWDGILVDDPEHPSDIVRGVRDVLTVLWPSGDGSLAESMEREACEILCVKELRDYFEQAGCFFENHLKRYSKSQRQAPIYWPLSTSSGVYTLWLYYHRLTSDTLYIAVNRYVEPKLERVRRRIAELEMQSSIAPRRETTRVRDALDHERDFLRELQEFRDELLRVAALPYKPDLNDGVIINAAPLHRLFRLPQWTKDAKTCWERLESGEHDWAHLAYTIWPDRVREKCRVDRSLAIAHDLEHLYIERPTIAQRKRSRKAVPDRRMRSDEGI
jgi:23S rRNA G2445 N2-methylase RlmL